MVELVFIGVEEKRGERFLDANILSSEKQIWSLLHAAFSKSVKKLNVSLNVIVLSTHYSEHPHQC